MKISKLFCCGVPNEPINTGDANGVDRHFNRMERRARRDNNTQGLEMISLVRNTVANAGQPNNKRAFIDGFMRLQGFYNWAENGPPDEIGNRLEAVKIISDAFTENRTPLSLRVNLSGLALTSLPERFAMVPSLTDLDISGNQLKELPPLPSTLLALHLNDNQLEHLPHLQDTLRYLNVRNNRLTELPLRMDLDAWRESTANRSSQFPIVRPSQFEVDVSNNYLKTFPEAFLRSNPHGNFGGNPWEPSAVQAFSSLPNAIIQPRPTEYHAIEITLCKFPVNIDQNAALNGRAGFYGGMTA